jgi:hypothetical protein
LCLCRYENAGRLDLQFVLNVVVYHSLSFLLLWIIYRVVCPLYHAYKTAEKYVKLAKLICYVPMLVMISIPILKQLESKLTLGGRKKFKLNLVPFISCLII